jgi:hypothetical protein
VVDGRNCVLGLGFYATDKESESEKGDIDARPMGVWPVCPRRSVANLCSNDFKLNLQCFKCRFNIGKFEEYGLVGYLFIVQQKADAPHYRREANVLGASQVVQHNLGVKLGCHNCF